jgi:hypothetical protein
MLAESHLTKRLFGSMVRRIGALAGELLNLGIDVGETSVDDATRLPWLCVTLGGPLKVVKIMPTMALSQNRDHSVLGSTKWKFRIGGKMNHRVRIRLATVAVFLAAAPAAMAFPGPFDGKNFKGRIAFGHDGNINDEDDWATLPAAIAILDAFGVTDKLVHVDYNNILPQNDPRFSKEMTASALGAADRYKIPRSIFFDCQKDLDGAVENLKNAINASSADDPLYYALSGTIEVFLRAVERSNPEKRRYVYCISHSEWNDGYTKHDWSNRLHTTNKRALIPSGIKWVGIQDGNTRLANPASPSQKSSPEQWSLYYWARDSRDANLNWLFTRLQAMGRGDYCDSTIAYFLLTGDEEATLDKYRSLLDEKKRPGQIYPRQHIRIEAEDFLILENYEVAYRIDKKASKLLSVRLASMAPGRIRTVFDQPYTADHGRYAVEIRYFDYDSGSAEFSLSVNGVRQGAPWRSSEHDNAWKIHTVPDVMVNTGDEITVEVSADSGDYANLDYVQLNYKGPPAGGN